MKKENQRVALTRRLLKESLLRLMADKDIREITVTELCADAQINRCTFYKHYGCTEDVLADIEHDVVEDLESLWAKNTAGTYWPMNLRVEALCRYLLEHKPMMKLLMRNTDTNTGFASLLISTAHVRTLYDMKLSYITDPECRRLFTSFLVNGTYHMIRQWLLDDSPITPEEMGHMGYLIATQGWERAFSADSAAHPMNGGEHHAMP
ncbi:MAG: TetR/AcrR family transcriptional regulator [Aristaeellaceae bacterium]